MTILFDGQNAFFAERGPTLSQSIALHLPKGASLSLNGAVFFPKEGAVHLPKSALRAGENVLSLRIDNRLFPCESLYFDGRHITPRGFSGEALLLRQHELISLQEEKLRELSARVEALESKARAKLLFS